MHADSIRIRAVFTTRVIRSTCNTVLYFPSLFLVLKPLSMLVTGLSKTLCHTSVSRDDLAVQNKGNLAASSMYFR